MGMAHTQATSPRTHPAPLMQKSFIKPLQYPPPPLIAVPFLQTNQPLGQNVVAEATYTQPVNCCIDNARCGNIISNSITDKP